MGMPALSLNEGLLMITEPIIKQVSFLIPSLYVAYFPFFFPLRTNLTFMQDSNVPTEVPAFPDFLILSDAILAKEM